MYRRKQTRPPGRWGTAGLALASAVPLLLAAGGGVAAAATGPGTNDASDTVSTLAGGVGGPGTGTSVSLLPSPEAVSYTDGSVYIPDGTVLRELNPATGYLTNVAGTEGLDSPMGANGAALDQVRFAVGTTAVDAAGNLLLNDGGHGRIRVVAGQTGTFYGQAMTAGHVYTIAGDGKGKASGLGGPALKARLGGVGAMSVDSYGNVILADDDANASEVLVVAGQTGTFYGQAMTAGDIYNVAGDGPLGGRDDGSPATSVKLDGLGGVTTDAAGNLLLTTSIHFDLVRVVAGATGTFYGQAMTAGRIYTIAGGGHSLPSGALATQTQVAAPTGVTVDAHGNVLVTAAGQVMVVAGQTGTFYGQAMTAGHLYPLTAGGTGGYNGDGQPASQATVKDPQETTFDGHGNVLIADTGNGRIRVIAATTGTFYGQAMQAGYIYTVAGNGKTYSGGSGPASRSVLNLFGGGEYDTSQSGVAQDPATGNVLFADSGVNLVQIIAGKTGTFYGLAMKAGDLYTVAGNGKDTGSAANGVLATTIQVPDPGGVAVDAAGNLLIAVTGDNRVRVVANTTGTFYGQAMTAGHIYTIAGGGTAKDLTGVPATQVYVPPDSVAVDASGNVLIGTDDDLVQIVPPASGTFYGQAMTAGDIYDVAGGGTATGSGVPATSAKLGSVRGLTVAANGSLYLADTGNSTVQVVAGNTGTFFGVPMTPGDIYTVASPGASTGVAVDTSGNLIFSTGNQISVVAATTGTFYGQAMTAGSTHTLAGLTTDGFNGNGLAATSTELNVPSGVAVESDGNLVFSDAGNNRIRLITY